MGLLAVLFWSFGSSLVYLGAREAGTWAFVALSSLIGGLLQLGLRRIQGGGWRSALVLPWRLWAIPLLCFVIYGLAWPCALVASSARQVAGVNLINYLWPSLTVLCSVLWVPGVRMTPRLAVGLTLALAGLAQANVRSLQELSGTASAAGTSLLPYALALVAAVTWAVYSSVLARWRAWARNYVTSPLGFLMIGVIASGVMLWDGGQGLRLSARGLLMILLYGAGPLAAGYLLWELALAKARVQTLSLVAAATPVLSTLWLCVFLRTMPGPELVAAALLISAGVISSR
jgi:drug/metabolite transporter (DMT)-like permease